MKLFPVDKLVGEFQGGSNIVGRNAVLRLYFAKSHSAREPSHDAGDRNTRPANDGLAVLDSRIKDDSIIHIAQCSKIIDPVRRACKRVTRGSPLERRRETQENERGKKERHSGVEGPVCA